MDSLLGMFSPISLNDMSGVKLMNRIDTKFVTTRAQLDKLLRMALRDYDIQEIDGRRNMLYDTTYFDTPNYDMYNDHQHGHCDRQKLRFRTYENNQLQFMEVKTKNNHGRTKKKRVQVTDMNLHDEQKLTFLQSTLHFDPGIMSPHMHNYFHRITLVNKQKTERLTIDTDLQFHNLQTGKHYDMDHLVIIELKRDGNSYSPILEMLRQLHIHPHGFSKYCMGAALTNDRLPINLFKEKLRDVQMILSKQYYSH